MTPQDLAKVHSARLRAMAESGDPEVVAAVVKVSVPGGPELMFRKSESGVRAFSIATPEGPSMDGVLDAAKARLEAITGRPARVIDVAQAIVIEATGPQLREIAALAEIADIYDNGAL